MGAVLNLKLRSGQKPGSASQPSPAREEERLVLLDPAAVEEASLAEEKPTHLPSSRWFIFLT
jgi:hypothetical protein